MTWIAKRTEIKNQVEQKRMELQKSGFIKKIPESIRMEEYKMSNIVVSTEGMSRKEWLAWRSKGLGGSDAAVACGLNKYKSRLQLWLEKTGQQDFTEQNEPMYFGNLLEPIVRQEYERRTGNKVICKPAILQHPNYPWQLANIDGMVQIPNENGTLENAIFEAKTASEYLFGEWDNGKIPELYQLQLLHYLSVTNYRKAIIAVLIGGNKFEIRELNYDAEAIHMLTRIEQNFWDCVIHKVAPEIDGSKAGSELLNRLYPKGEPIAIELPESAKELIQQYHIAAQAEKEYSQIKEKAGNQLKQMLGSNETGKIGNNVVSWKTISSTRLDTAKLKSEQQDIYSKYVEQSSYRRFAVK